MHLLVKPNGGEHRGLITGMPLGIYPEVDLREVRTESAEAKLLIFQGDPMVERKLQKIQLHAAHENIFECLAYAWFAIISPK